MPSKVYDKAFIEQRIKFHQLQMDNAERENNLKAMEQHRMAVVYFQCYQKMNGGDSDV